MESFHNDDHQTTQHFFQTDENGHLVGHEIVDHDGNVTGFDLGGQNHYSIKHEPSLGRQMVYDEKNHQIGEITVDKDGTQHISDLHGHDYVVRPRPGDDHTVDLFTGSNAHLGSMTQGPTGVDHFEGDPIGQMNNIRFDHFEG